MKMKVAPATLLLIVGLVSHVAADFNMETVTLAVANLDEASFPCTYLMEYLKTRQLKI